MCIYMCVCFVSVCVHVCVRVCVCVCVCVCVHGSNFMYVNISLCSYFFILTKWVKQSLQRDNSLRSSTEQLIPPADDQSINNTGMYVYVCTCIYTCVYVPVSV